MPKIIKVSGPLDRASALAVVAGLTDDDIYTLDFDEVPSVQFAALRALLNARKSGLHFCVVNACDEVAERFEDTGVSSFVNICRRPKPLVLGEYDEFGKSYLSTAYNSADGDSMIKVYGTNVPEWTVAQEKAVARAVMVFGIPTPLVGSLYKDGDKVGLDFERIEGKRSFARIVGDDPSRTEEIAERFAKMCLQLHATRCDTNIFADRSIFYRKCVLGSDLLSEELRGRMLAFLDSVPCETTCIHGDMHLGNVITNGEEDLWIDLSDFGYGNHMFDLGMLYFLSKFNPEELIRGMFHFGLAEMNRFWDKFIEVYFEADTAAKRAAAEASILPFAALHMFYIGSNAGFVPGMLEFVKDFFSKF